jgi:hypothetical protein
MNPQQMILAALRSSEFWALAAQAVVEAMSLPVPDEMKAVGWVYIALRVAGKLAKYVFPNPDGGAWFKKD